MELFSFWVGKTRLEAARIAECERCAKVIENYAQNISGMWTAADDHAPPRSETLAVMAALQEAARRIRKRNDNRVERLKQ